MNPINSSSEIRRTVAAGTRGGVRVIYDPLTGSTRLTSHPDVGRITLSSRMIADLPEVHPGDLGGTEPVSVCWSPIVRCNLACSYCLDDKQVPELSRSERHAIAANLADSGVLGVDISGGEPLLLRELPELLDTLVDGGHVVSVTTNGTHLERRAESLARRVDAIRVSLDGADAATHDSTRGTGSFAKAVSGIRAAVGHGIPLQIQTVVMRSTITRLPDIVDLADQLGALGVTFLQFLPFGEGANLADAELISDDDVRALVDCLASGPVEVRLRTRADAAGFTVVRSDGKVWRNADDTSVISPLRVLTAPHELSLSGRDGSA